MKTIWRAWPGASPELDMLTRLADDGFRRTPVPAAAIDYVDGGGHTFPAAFVTSYLPHQTTAWDYTLDELSRFFDEALTTDLPGTPPPRLASWWADGALPPKLESMAAYGRTAAAVGLRIAELHATLQGGKGTRDGDIRSDWARRADAAWESARTAIENTSGLPETTAALAAELVSRAEDIRSFIRRVREGITTAHTVGPVHGVLDLGQERVKAWSRWWVASAAAPLLSAYRQGTVGIVPADAEDVVQVLVLLMLERAFRDVAQAVTSTPEWLEPALLAALQVVD